MLIVILLRSKKSNLNINLINRPRKLFDENLSFIRLIDNL